jgi:hypothetical protein
MHFHFEKGIPVFWNDGVYFNSSIAANKLHLFAQFEERGCAITDWRNEIASSVPSFCIAKSSPTDVSANSVITDTSVEAQISCERDDEREMLTVTGQK